MREELVEEMKAKVAANCGMTLGVDQVKEVLAELTSAETVQSAALGAETIAASIPPKTNEVEAAILAEAHTLEFTPMIQEKSGPLPESFPGRHALAGAGINTFAQVRKARDSKEGLTGLTGIGDATATAIEEALNVS